MAVTPARELNNDIAARDIGYGEAIGVHHRESTAEALVQQTRALLIASDHRHALIGHCRAPDSELSAGVADSGVAVRVTASDDLSQKKTKAALHRLLRPRPVVAMDCVVPEVPFMDAYDDAVSLMQGGGDGRDPGGMALIVARTAYSRPSAFQWPSSNMYANSMCWQLPQSLVTLRLEILANSGLAGAILPRLLENAVRGMVMNTLTNMIIEALIPHGFLSVRESIVASIKLAMSSRIGSGSARTRMLAILLALIPQRAA